ncbi:C1 family peptidase [Chloroflexota bacterium]
MSPGPLPSSFYWHATSDVTSVKNQDSCGSCYAFAGLAQIESLLLINSGTTYDFSENNAKECNYHEVAYIDGGTSCNGGTFLISSSTCSNRKGWCWR